MGFGKIDYTMKQWLNGRLAPVKIVFKRP